MNVTIPGTNLQQLSINIAHDGTNGVYQTVAPLPAWTPVAYLHFTKVAPWGAYNFWWKWLPGGVGAGNRTLVYMPPVPGVSVNSDQGILLDPCALTGLVNLNDTMKHAPNTATLGSDVTVCKGQGANLNVTISTDGTGCSTQSYLVIYTDGTTTYSAGMHPSGTSTFALAPTPLVTTTYSLVSVTDCNGCSVTGLYGRPVVTVKLNTVNVRVLLQGPWTGSGVNMTNYLILPDLYLPGTEPYDLNTGPAGSDESVATGFFTSNTGFTDWVAVGVRTTATGTVAWQPGLLKQNGYIVDLNGTSALAMPTVLYGQTYYLVVHQRNHLGVQSATSGSVNIACNLDYDFTDAMSKAYPNPWSNQAPMVQLATGVFGLFAADATHNHFISSSDWNLWLNFNGLLGYYGTDMNLDSSTDSYDTNTFWAPNNGKASQAETYPVFP
jgi:hypothetical protein